MQGRLPLTKTQWIEKYGGQALLDAEGFDVVPCLGCDDSICHEWQVIKKIAGTATGRLQVPGPSFEEVPRVSHALPYDFSGAEARAIQRLREL